MAAKVERYENLLIELLMSQDASKQQIIRNVLTEASEVMSRYADDDSVSGDEANEEEQSVSVAGSSPRFQDRPRHALIELLGSTGYFGSASVVHWMKDVMVKLATYGFARRPAASGLDGLSAMTTESLNEINSPLLLGFSYFSSDIPEPQSITTAFQLPPESTGEALLNSYFSTIHMHFPILVEREFIFQWRSYCQTTQPPNGSCLWVAILNVVFAIGALYAERVQIQYECLENHTIYWIRSHVLGQEPIQIIGLPTIEHIQLLTISGLYCIASYQINRACYLLSLGVRYAYNRALHLLNATSSYSDEETELQVKVWHSLCSAERLASLLTGLPSSIQDRFVPTQLPNAAHPTSRFEPVTINSVSTCHTSPYCLNTFANGLLLDAIVQETLVALYGSNTTRWASTRVQQIVVELDEKLTHWQADLAPGAMVWVEHGSDDSAPLVERMYLSLRFLATRILINRPGLSDTCELNTAISPQYEPSRRSLEMDAAIRCISAARSLARLFPHHFDAAEFYRTSPWWSVVHYLVQAGVVLVMEISFDVQHVPTEADNIIAESALIIRWLQTLSHTNDSIHRAYMSLNRLLELALEKARKNPNSVLGLTSNTSDPQTTPSIVPAFHARDPNFLRGTNWPPA
ncbi:hypothetical protein LOZ66_004108 [Ophidiomyces ophidiicola]|nr:hypothetical protein LOZ66_004108 [Ophidiomyces ophidiicola]